jgi:hypothetical protein
MKRIFLAAIIGSVLISCEKNDHKPLAPQSYEVMQHPVWTAEDFKSQYTIQFPSGYTGKMQGFEGNTFHKKDAAGTTQIGYFYSNNTYCSDFRDILTDPIQPSILSIFVYNQVPVLLSHRVEFTSNNQLTGVLYHDNGALLKGILFWKDDGIFKEAATVQSTTQNLPEVINILRTIRKE